MKVCTTMYLFIAMKEYKIVVEKLSRKNLVVPPGTNWAVNYSPNEICSSGPILILNIYGKNSHIFAKCGKCSTLEK